MDRPRDRAGILSELEGFRGYLLELDGVAAYQITDHFGIGGGVKYYNVNVTDRNESGDTRFDMQFIGPTIFVYGNF